jgi:hypothetical protein
MIWRRENILLVPLKGVGPGNLDFFGIEWHLLCLMTFQGQKQSQFPSPPPFQTPLN